MNHYYNIVQCKIICSKPLPFAISFLPSLTCEKECTVKEGSSNTTLFHFTAHGNGTIDSPPIMNIQNIQAKQANRH